MLPEMYGGPGSGDPGPKPVWKKEWVVVSRLTNRELAWFKDIYVLKEYGVILEMISEEDYMIKKLQGDV